MCFQKEETKKKGPVLVALLDPKKSLAVNLIIKNLRRKNDAIAEAITACDFEKLNPDQINGLLKIIPESTEVGTLFKQHLFAHCTFLVLSCSFILDFLLDTDNRLAHMYTLFIDVKHTSIARHTNQWRGYTIA